MESEGAFLPSSLARLYLLRQPPPLLPTSSSNSGICWMRFPGTRCLTNKYFIVAPAKIGAQQR